MSYLGNLTHESSSQLKFSEKLKENFENALRARAQLHNFREHCDDSIREVSIGPKYIGILTVDGAVARIPYILLNNDKTDSAHCNITPNITNTSNNTTSTSAQNHNRITRWNSTHAETESEFYSRYIEQFAPRFGLQSVAVSRRMRNNTNNQNITSNVSEVSEDLIAQVQAVLQGHDRNTIATELLRNRLDINRTVDSLLSAEDDRNNTGNSVTILPTEIYGTINQGILNTGNTSNIININNSNNLNTNLSGNASTLSTNLILGNNSLNLSQNIHNLNLNTNSNINLINTNNSNVFNVNSNNNLNNNTNNNANSNKVSKSSKLNDNNVVINIVWEAIEWLIIPNTSIVNSNTISNNNDINIDNSSNINHNLHNSHNSSNITYNLNDSKHNVNNSNNALNNQLNANIINITNIESNSNVSVNNNENNSNFNSNTNINDDNLHINTDSNTNTDDLANLQSNTHTNTTNKSKNSHSNTKSNNKNYLSTVSSNIANTPIDNDKLNDKSRKNSDKSKIEKIDKLVNCEKLDKNNSVKNVIFKAVGCMYSDIYALSTTGVIYQWTYNSATSVPQHPGSIHFFNKAKSLGIANEEILDIACSFARATAVTRSNKVVTWMDSILTNVGQIESCMVIAPDQKHLKIRKLSVNNLYSVALLEDGSLWWWGAMPHESRARIISSEQKKPKKNIQEKKIEIGAFVTHRANNYIPTGSLAFYCDNSKLKMGKLNEPILSLKTTAKFIPINNGGSFDHSKILNQSASASIEDLSILAGSNANTSKNEGKSTGKAITIKKNPRKRKHSHANAEAQEQIWELKDVVFLHENSNEIGQVVKIDHENVLVEFAQRRRSLSKSRDVKDVCRLKNSRIMNINELKVIKHIPRKKSLPHYQSTPKRFEYGPHLKVIGCSSTETGVKVLLRLEDNSYVTDLAVPGYKIFEFNKVDTKGSQMIPESVDFVDMNVIGDCMVINIPGTSNYSIFASDCTRWYSLFDFPTIPEINLLRAHKFGKVDNYLIFYTHSHFISLASSEAHLMSHYVDNSYYKNQNVIHMLSQMSFVTEVSYQNFHINFLQDRFKDLVKEAGLEKIKELLLHKDIDGLTPFLYSIKIRSYKFAVFLYNFILETNDAKFLAESTFNQSLGYLFNPLYLLCTNESCTYTWTMNCHTPQDIYECRTCGVVDNLCLCTECMTSCHRGHDCVRKERSQSAFCDCWQKCVCSSLISGDQSSRKHLFRLLMKEHHLLNNLGSGNEHLLLLVVRSFSRQNKNFRDFKKIDINKRDTRNVVSNIKDRRQSIHGFSIRYLKKPGKFIVYALKLLLTSKEVLSTLFTTVEQYSPDLERESNKNIPYFTSTYDLVPSQSCGKLFDSFLFTLFTKCDKSVTSIIFRTLKNSFSDQETFSNPDSNGVLVNFIRSCIRLYVVIVSTMSPMLLAEASKRSPNTNDQYRVLYRLVLFFKKFPLTSIIQMSKMSVSIVSPIIYGSLTSKPNSHPLFTKMSDVNDYVSGFFSSVQTSIGSIKPKRTVSRGTLMIDAENLINSQTALLDQEDDITYSDEEDEDEEEEEDEEQEEEYYDSDESEYTNYSNMNEDEDHTQDEFTSVNIESIIQEDPTIIIEAEYDSHGTSPSEVTSSRNRPQPTTLTQPRRRLTSPFYIRSGGSGVPTRQQDSPMPIDNYHWAVRSNNNPTDARIEGMAVLRTNTDTYGEGHALLLNTQTGLARSFMILVKLISDLCTHSNFFALDEIFEKVFVPTIGQVFLWLFDSCERIESKLRFGLSSIVNSVPNLQSGRFDYDFTQHDSNNNELGAPASRIRRRTEDRSLSLSNKNRSEFLSNLISLMRCHENDHDGILPYVDLSGFKHLAYLLDAVSYFLASFSNSKSLCDSFIKLGEYSLILQDGSTQAVATDFFHRTSSTLSFSNFTNLMTPLSDSIPLAVNPSILSTYSTKKSLFTSKEYDIKVSDITSAAYDFSSFRLFNSEEKGKFVKDLITSSPHVFYVRWYHTFDTFSQIFSESVTAEPASVFREICRYETKETSFKLFLEKFKISCSGEVLMEHLDRKPEKLLVQTFKLLNTYFQKRDPNKNNGYTFSRLKAQFRNEPGEGSGVTRNFFSAIFEAIKSLEKLPDLAPIVDINSSSVNRPRTSNIINVGEGSFYTRMNFPEDEIDSPLPSTGRFMPRMTTYTRNPLPRMQNIPPHRTWSDSIQETARTGSQTTRNIHDQLDITVQPRSRVITDSGNSRDITSDTQRVRIFNEMLLRGDISHDNSQSRVSSHVSSSSRARRASMSAGEAPIALNQIEDMARNPSTPANAQLENRIRIFIKKAILRYLPTDIVHTVLEMIMQLSPDVLHTCIQNPDFLKTKVESIIKLIGGVKEKYKITYGFMDTSIFNENTALFFQPGRPGFYFPVNAKKTFLRLNAYKNVGRLIGLSILVEELIPFILCRPVVKFLLDRPISFHDFAFYDPIQYESLRLLKIEAQESREKFPDTVINLHDLTYCLTIIDCDNKPHTVELIPGGYQKNVTTHNVDHYIQSYVEYYLINSVKPELTAIREGLYETINPFPLKIFSPEDFRLLTNGSLEVSLDVMKKIVTFTDETSTLSSEKIQRFQNWFWDVVESLDEQQKSDLLLFWTSSPLLNETQTNRRPNVVIKAPSDHLPTSNTCVMRLYVPAYPKKSILRSKILLAIKTKSFGFI